MTADEMARLVMIVWAAGVVGMFISRMVAFFHRDGPRRVATAPGAPDIPLWARAMLALMFAVVFSLAWPVTLADVLIRHWKSKE